MNNDNRTFYKWTWFRAWFPVLFFVAFWVNSYLNRNIGLLIRDPISLNTHIYLWVSMILFIVGYAIGLGKPKRILVQRNEQVWKINSMAFKWFKLLIWVTFIGCLGTIVDRILSGAGSIGATVNETEFVRTEMMENTTILTTLSMGLFMFAFMAFSIYFMAVATNYPMPNYYHWMIYGTYGMLCLTSVLIASRGFFLSVITYIAYMLFCVQGETLLGFIVKKKYFFIRLVSVSFIIFSLLYFIFISRYRGGEEGIKADTLFYYQPNDRYGLYKLDFDALNITAFLQTYSYMIEGYEYIDYFLEMSSPFAFRPAALLGGRMIRQIQRVVPEEYRRPPAAVEVGNSWRSAAGMHLFGWPTVWGWNLPMFGYIGAPLFMLFYGMWMGYCSGIFLRFANIGALMVCFANYSILMNSFNSLGGDVYHQIAIWVGIVWMYKINKQTRLLV